jgi:AcrR family transcriptional regulator
MSHGAESGPATASMSTGRPRSANARRAILDAFHELLIEVGFAQVRLEHVAARAGTSKATIYRRWRSKDEVAIDLIEELATPNAPIGDLGGTRDELMAITLDVNHRLTEAEFGPVIRRMLGEIVGNAALSERFRSTVVRSRREEVRSVVERGIDRGDLCPSADPDIITELIVGSVYSRSLFGDGVDAASAATVVDVVLEGVGTGR